MEKENLCVDTDKSFMDYINNKIIRIVNSNEFKERLEKINRYYFNLKQEFHIRNLFLELLNDSFYNDSKSDLKAISEYPRINNKRVDLSIYDKKNKTRFSIEFKFQFSRDYNQFTKYKDLVNNDFIKRDTSLFILIIEHWNRPKKEKSEKEEYDDNWGIEHGLTKYIAYENEKEWENNINKILREYINAKLITKSIFITKLFDVEYYFYFLQKKECK